MAGPKRVLNEAKDLAVDKTSSINNYVVCDNCELKLKTKEKLLLHLSTCVASRTCTQCNQVFKNRVTLSNHNRHIHGVICQKKNFTCDKCPKSYKYEKLLKYHELRVHTIDYKINKRETGEHEQNAGYQCKPCCKSYKYGKTLRMHIRSVHFNLKSTDAEVLSKKVNDVWYERVLNTDMLVRIKKTGRNRYMLNRTCNSGLLKNCSPDKEQEKQ